MLEQPEASDETKQNSSELLKDGCGGSQFRKASLPSFTAVVVIGFMFCVLCHAATTFALFSYIDQKVGGPTSKAIDTVLFGYAPIGASALCCCVTIYLARVMFRQHA